MIKATCDVCGVDYTKDYLGENPHGYPIDNKYCGACSKKINDYRYGQLREDQIEFTDRQLNAFIYTLKAEMGNGILTRQNNVVGDIAASFAGAGQAQDRAEPLEKYNAASEFEKAKAYAEKIKHVTANGLICSDPSCHCVTHINRNLEQGL